MPTADITDHPTYPPALRFTDAAGSWSAVGDPVPVIPVLNSFGEEESRSPLSVDLSANGRVLAMTVWRDGTFVYERGSVSSSWVQIGDKLPIANGCCYEEPSVISDDGRTVVVTSSGIDGSYGKVVAYRWNGNGWAKQGGTIGYWWSGMPADSIELKLNGFVGAAISGNGRTLVLGSSRRWQYSSNHGKGSTTVLDWNGTTWARRGQDMEGHNTGDSSGFAVAITGDGSMVAIGSVAGKYVDVYVWDNSGWKRRGNPVYVSQVLYSSYLALSSRDGSVLLIGSYKEGTEDTGAVQAYAWSESESDWVRRGDIISGLGPNDRAGYHVSMSSDGSAIAFSGNFYTRVFAWNGASWIQRGDGIPSTGGPISLSADGRVLAVGLQMDGQAGKSEGSTIVYEFTTL